jgi:NADH-quinone oxidoreductase subunit C
MTEDQAAGGDAGMEQPTQRANQLGRAIQARLGELVESSVVHAGQLTLITTRGNAPALLRGLRDTPELAFSQLMDVCGIDYLEHGQSDWSTSDRASRAGFSRGVKRLQESELETGRVDGRRFAGVYHLLSVSHNARVRVRVYAEGEPPRLDSVVDIWPCADWYEREAFDLFGILFEGHPDLRRLLTDYGFIGHPFRKDFPLVGEVEMRYDPEKRRVVYEPVTITERTLVPRVIREDERYSADGSGVPPGAA